MPSRIFPVALMGFFVAACRDTAGCERGCTGIAGYAIVTGIVTRADNTPYFETANDAVTIQCGYAPDRFAHKQPTDRNGRYRFDLQPAALPASHLLPCIVSAGPAPAAADTINVRFALTRDTRETFVVNLRLP